MQAQAASNWPITLFSDPLFEYVSMLLPGNGTNGGQNNTFLDSSTNNFTITRNGNTTQGSVNPYGTLWSNYFVRASSQSLSAATTSALNFGTSDFTVEAWINLSSLAGMAIVIGSDTNSFFFRVKNTNGLQIARTGVADLEFCDFNFVVGTWFHVAVVRNSGVIKFYVNGAEQTTQGSGGSSYNFGNESTTLIGQSESNAEYFNGYISNLRVTKSAVYTANFTPSTTPLTAITNTSFLTCQSNRFRDASSNNSTISVYSGTPSVQRFSPFNPPDSYSPATLGGSGFFDGTGDSLLAPVNSNLSVSTGNFTFETWIYPTSFSGFPVLFFWNSDSSSSFANVYVALGTTGEVYFLAQGDGGWQVQINSAANTVFLNMWQHIAAVRNGNDFRIYINGVSAASTSFSGDLNTTVSSNQIGRRGSAQHFFGYMAGIRITKSAVYTTAFTPPTTPPIAIANTQLLLNCTNANIVDAATVNNLETVGGAQTSTVQFKFGGSSIYLDGSGDYLTVPANRSLSFNTGDFTIECWVYQPIVNGNNGILQISPVNGGFQNGSANTIALALAGNDVYVYAAGNVYNTTNTPMPVSEWTHIALVRSSGVTRLYINGVLNTTIGSSGSVTDTTNYTGTFAVIGGYFSTSFTLNGYIDDLRITNGVARYTANFTPPTAALPTF